MNHEKEESSMNEQRTDIMTAGEDPEERAVAESSGEMDRREALAALGKFALFTTPVMTTLLTSRKAAAFSNPPGPPPS
jgi:hypothetical protein